MDMNERVTYSADGSVATITMDDGKANALSPAMLAELADAFDRAEKESLAVVLTGRPGAFSAGFDLNVLRAGGPEALDMMITGFRLSARMLSFPRPFVIAATGHAIAMGVFLCLSADYRVGSDGTFKVGANEVAIGLTMPRFGVEICRQRLSPAYFSRAVTGAELFTPAEAVTAGFLDHVTDAEQAGAIARAEAERRASLPAEAYAATKLRMRASALEAINAAIDADEKEFQSFLP
jgi:enoyl-CoA hydratase